MGSQKAPTGPDTCTDIRSFTMGSTGDELTRVQDEREDASPQPPTQHKEQHLNASGESKHTMTGRHLTGCTQVYVEQLQQKYHAPGPAGPSTIRRLAHLDEYQHSNPVPLALFLVIFFIVGMVVLRFTRSSAEPKKRCRKALTMKTKVRNSRSL